MAVEKGTACCWLLLWGVASNLWNWGRRPTTSIRLTRVLTHTFAVCFLCCCYMLLLPAAFRPCLCSLCCFCVCLQVLLSVWLWLLLH